jgi:hypothetical protein
MFNSLCLVVWEWKVKINKCKVSSENSSSYSLKFKQSKVLVSNGWVDSFESLWKLV